MTLKKHFWKINKKKGYKENHFYMIILYANIYEIRGRSPKKPEQIFLIVLYKKKNSQIFGLFD